MTRCRSQRVCWPECDPPPEVVRTGGTSILHHPSLHPEADCLSEPERRQRISLAVILALPA